MEFKIKFDDGLGEPNDGFFDDEIFPCDDFRGFSSDSADIYDPSDSNSSASDSFKLRSANNQSIVSITSDLDVGDIETGLPSTHIYLEELNNAALCHISNFRKRSKKQESINIESFDEHEKIPYSIIKTHADIILYSMEKTDVFLNSLKFFFQDENPFNDEECSIEICSAVLNARPFVIQTRMQYDFYLKWTILKGAFTFNCRGIPYELRDVLAYLCPIFYDEMLDVSNLIWKNPGVAKSEIVENFRFTEKMLSEFDRLEKAGFVAINHANQCYLTGRNPSQDKNFSLHTELQKGKTIFWGNLWPKL